uniref:Ankyrin repeat domain-containing protein 54 n=1 Tax=Daphnia galeata TaxID=27404 RepID=A0A8J2S1M1_9CRUS|nr:unnamed protein product [Daphnia galeata]
MASAECSLKIEECTRRVLESVSMNLVTLFESAIETYSEIQLLNSLANCNEEASSLHFHLCETPVAIAIKSDCVPVVKKMMAFLRNALAQNIVENQLKITFIIHQLLHKFPIEELIDNLIYDPIPLYRREIRPHQWLMFFANIVTNCKKITRQDKIILLEVIGSALITQLCEPQFFIEGETLCGNYGLECWREAMTLRYFPQDGGDVMPKLPNFNVPSESSSFIFGSAVEVATIEELDLLQEDLKQNYLNVQMPIQCLGRMVIQALLVLQRISHHLGHPHWLYPQSFLDFAGFVFEFTDDFRIKTCLCILEELTTDDPNLLPPRTFGVLIQTLDRLSDYFIEALSEPPNSPEGRELNYANILIITKLATAIQPNHPHFQFFANIYVLMGVIYRLVFILDSISSRITSQEKQILETFYYDYFRARTERTPTVLQMAVQDICESTKHARLQTIQRILKFGADPNASDWFGRTPLHYLAERTQYNADESIPLFQVLLDAGAHLDVTADDGKTVICILKEKLEGKENPYFESLINTVFPLTCLCAGVIRRHGIPFEDRLPPRLKKLVSSHSAKASIDLHQPRR